MRLIFSLLVIAAAGYVGYSVYLDKFAAKPSGEDQAPGEVAATAPAKPAVQPAFESKIALPPAPVGEKRLAPPGVFYMIDRVSVEHANGIAAIIPGEPVKLMQRKGDGTLKVTTGRLDVEVKESQITNDLDVARDAERKYALAHPLKR